MFYATSFSLLFFANSPALAQQGDLDIGSSDPLQESLDQSVEEMNNIYVVQPGDTLWSLSAAVLGDPESWPELWSINDYITNPHWIYPGNEVVFTLGTLLEPPKIDLETTERRGFQPTEVRIETTDVSCGPDVRFDFPQNTGIFTVPGFISDPEELFTVGKVSRARKNKVFLVEDDLVYLELDNPEDFSCQEKDVLTIFRRVKAVRCWRLADLARRCVARRVGLRVRGYAPRAGSARWRRACADQDVREPRGHRRAASERRTR